MKAKGVIATGLILFGGAVYGIHTDKMRVTTVCRDARLFMDGGINANIESGGLNFHRSIKLYKTDLKKLDYVGELLVSKEISGAAAPVESYAGDNFKLTISKDLPVTKFGYPSHLDAALGKDVISVSLLCSKK